MMRCQWTLFYYLLTGKIINKFASDGKTQYQINFCFRIHGKVALFPHISARYTRGLIVAINKSNIGCNVGDVFFNIIAYADDLVLISRHGMLFNSLLTSCSQQRV